MTATTAPQTLLGSWARPGGVEGDIQAMGKKVTGKPAETSLGIRDYPRPGG